MEDGGEGGHLFSGFLFFSFSTGVAEWRNYDEKGLGWKKVLHSLVVGSEESV